MALRARRLPWRLTAWVCLLGCGHVAAMAAENGATMSLRTMLEARSAASVGPLAAAQALLPDIAPPPQDTMAVEAGLRHDLHARVGGQALSIGTDLWARHARRLGAAGADDDTRLRVNELHASTELGAWTLSAGKRIVGWDVGQGFRPNDVVQQEARRSLLDSTPEGRPLWMAERFDGDSALALVWVNPHHAGASVDASRGADESALAARAYWRRGEADWHAVARWGERTGASVGAALAWVAHDELELHASWRALQRHDGWQLDAAAASQPLTTAPWALTTQGQATQWLIGMNWTGALRQSLLIEAWHDGAALPDREWSRWTARTLGLVESRAPAQARAGNLAWQALPLTGQNLRRDNLFVRLSWQPGAWTLTLDLLRTPADGGRVVTAAAQWQGDRMRVNATWRWVGGSHDAVIAQLPLRQQGVLAASWAF